jgi:hypothetical protein
MTFFRIEMGNGDDRVYGRFNCFSAPVAAAAAYTETVAPVPGFTGKASKVFSRYPSLAFLVS